MMNKFIYKGSPNSVEYWEFCNKNKYPFITVNNIDKDFSEIFFDITNISNSLEDISNSVKEISHCYNEFFYIPAYISEKYNNQYYYFEFPARKEHAEFIANQLFNYLNEKLKTT